MAYNNYYPATYTPMYPQQVVQQPMYQQQAQPMPPVAQTSSSITWVQGEAGAKAHPLAPGSNALLMDAERDFFYIKSTDPSGMPMPLRIFEYKEVVPVEAKQSHDAPPVDLSEYAKKEDVVEIRKMLEDLTRQNRQRGDRNNGKQSV